MKKYNLIYFAVIMLLMVGCATRKLASDNGAAVVGKQWQLVELRGKSVPAKVNGKMPFLKLDEGNGRYSASGGCNGIGGEYTLQKDNGIVFSRGMSTMMACVDMHIENELRTLFEEVDAYTVSEETLTLSVKESGEILAKFKLTSE